MSGSHFGTLDTLAEIERLTAHLAKANSNHERFEREWYLRGDEIERLTAELDKANAIIDELIACKVLKESFVNLRAVGIKGDASSAHEAGRRYDMFHEYARRKPLAWKAAIAHRKLKGTK